MIITVAHDEGLKHRVVACLRDTRWSGAVTAVDTVGAAQDVLRRVGAARVVVVGRSIGLDGAAELVATAAGLRQAPAILVVAEPSTEALRAAMRAGIRDVLPPDFGPEELVRAFDEAGVSSEGPPPLPGVTVAVFSTKGGVGTSVVASNLAIRLGVLAGVPTTLVDLDLASADQAIMHGLSPRWTIQDLAEGAVGTDVESLGQVLLSVPGTEARILPGPVDPALAETITPGHVTSVVSAARAEAEVVVLDTASSFDDRTLAALDLADVIVVTSSLDVGALRSLTVSLQTLERLGIDAGKVRIALVRSDSKSGLLVGDVERAIERPVDVGIPSTRAVPRSVNEGVPLAVGSPKAAVVGAIDELAELVLVAAPDRLSVEADDDGGGLFPWSRSRRSSRGREPMSGASTPPPPPDPAPTLTGEPSAEDPAEDADSLFSSAEGDEGPPASEEAGDAGVVLPMERGRPASAAPRRRVVRSRDPEPSDGDVDAVSPEDAESTDDGDAIDHADTTPLSDMPPPSIVPEDDDGDQPRRRRRR